MSYLLFRKKMILDATKQNIPILGEFELTAKCNLKCEMCYVVDQQAKDLDTQTWITLFKQAVSSGLIFALLTGGELFTRSDAIVLYNTLYDLGVKITVYTNGTCITEAIADALVKRPPESVVITLYGASDETYHHVTNQKNAFNLVKTGIARLQARHINLILRTIPIKPLYQDLENMISFAKANHLLLNYLRYVGPARSGCRDALSIRLSPEELIDFEKRLQHAFGFRSEDTFSTSTNGATCAALKSAYFINYAGVMQPCAMAYRPAKSLLGQDFSEVFDELANELRELEQHHVCLSCHLKTDCMQCYARRMLEQDEASCPPYLRAYAELKGRGH